MIEGTLNYCIDMCESDIVSSIKRECRKRNSDLSLLSFNLLVVIHNLMSATFSRRCFAVLELLYFVPSAFYADMWRTLDL